VALASTDAPHAGHSNSSTASSENSAPQEGHAFASSSTAVPHTGHSNTPAVPGTAGAVGRPGSARGSSEAAPSFAALLIASKMSPFISFPSVMESRRSSMLALEGIFIEPVSSSSSASTSNRLKSVWQELQRFASASISASQTGHSLVSARTVWRHLETGSIQK